MKNQAKKQQTLLNFENRVAYLVTELNGLSGSIVNQEVTATDFKHDLTPLFDKLGEVEGAVRELADLFFSDK